MNGMMGASLVPIVRNSIPLADRGPTGTRSGHLRLRRTRLISLGALGLPP